MIELVNVKIKVQFNLIYGGKCYILSSCSTSVCLRLLEIDMCILRKPPTYFFVVNQKKRKPLKSIY